MLRVRIVLALLSVIFCSLMKAEPNYDYELDFGNGLFANDECKAAAYEAAKVCIAPDPLHCCEKLDCIWEIVMSFCDAPQAQVNKTLIEYCRYYYRGCTPSRSLTLRETVSDLIMKISSILSVYFYFIL